MEAIREVKFKEIPLIEGESVHGVYSDTGQRVVGRVVYVPWWSVPLSAVAHHLRRCAPSFSLWLVNKALHGVDIEVEWKEED